jgi:glycosyltransferase involved in cell wall biosynthesis
MEKPVLAYRSGGVADAMIDNETGYLIGRGNVAGLEKRLNELLLDPKKRAVMGREGREHVVRKFSHTAFAERHEKWYLSVIANQRVLP